MNQSLSESVSIPHSKQFSSSLSAKVAVSSNEAGDHQYSKSSSLHTTMKHHYEDPNLHCDCSNAIGLFTDHSGLGAKAQHLMQYDSDLPMSNEAPMEHHHAYCNAAGHPTPSGDSSIAGASIASSSMASHEYFSEDSENDIMVVPEVATSEYAARFEPVLPPNLDHLLAQEMARLSMKEREQALFDVHGVSGNHFHQNVTTHYFRGDITPREHVETAKFVQDKLQELEDCLARIAPKDKVAYLMARQQDPMYVEDPEFRQAFLRADLWNPIKTAKRIVLHFETKLDLFGANLLAQDITQADLDEETLESIYSGYMQYLPLRDRVGRLVHVLLCHPNSISLKAKLKRMFYMKMVTNEDLETQRKGRVAIAYMVGGSQIESNPRSDWQLGRMMNALPIRFDAIHMCTDTPSIWRPLFSVFKYVATLFLRLRMREHCGSHEHCLLQLRTFGIPVNCMPLEISSESSTASISMQAHVKFWKQRANLEELRRRHALHPDETLEASLAATISLSPAISSEIYLLEVDQASHGDTGHNTMTSDGYTSTVSMSQESTSTITKTEAPNRRPATQKSSRISKTRSFRSKKWKPKPPKSSPRISKQRFLQDAKISVPGQVDVLLGRGKGNYQHSGNIRFRHWIESRREEYDEAATSSDKKRITYEVMELVHSNGGRFLKESPVGWTLVGDETARQKVAHVFRSLREQSIREQSNVSSCDTQPSLSPKKPQTKKTSFAASNTDPENEGSGSDNSSSSRSKRIKR